MRQQEKQEQTAEWFFLPKKTPKRWTWTLDDPSTWIDDEEWAQENE